MTDDDVGDNSTKTSLAVASPPVVSGRTWERVQPQPPILQRTNNVILVRDPGEPAVLAYFKWPKAGSKHSSAYSIGVDRVGNELAKRLSLPVCDAYLEEFEGNHGLISIRAPHSQLWRALDEAILKSRPTFKDRGSWPILLGLDVLLGNTDRNADSVLVQMEASQHRPRKGQECGTFFIDYGHIALWPPWKFKKGLTGADLLKIDATDPLTADAIGDYRGEVPMKIRAAFPLCGTTERTEVVETVRQITHDALQEAVGNVSKLYFTAPAADLTIRWIDGRLGHLDTLLDEVFPL